MPARVLKCFYCFKKLPIVLRKIKLAETQVQSQVLQTYFHLLTPYRSEEVTLHELSSTTRFKHDRKPQNQETAAVMSSVESFAIAWTVIDAYQAEYCKIVSFVNAIKALLRAAY